MEYKNYVIGRGKLYFARRDKTTGTLGGFRFLGNAPEFSINITADMVDHYQSTGGIKEKDLTVPLQTNRTGSFTLDDIQPENVAFALYGQAQTLAVAAAIGLTETINGVTKGFYYPLGMSGGTGSGALNVTVTAIQNTTTNVALVAGTDYEVDQASGFIHILPTATNVADGDNIQVTYDQNAYDRVHIPAGREPINGALRYVSDNPVGKNQIVYAPNVNLSPDGDMQFIGDDWMQIPVSAEFLVPADGGVALYIDNNPIA